jgi:CheY-like chemotaxis protein
VVLSDIGLPGIDGYEVARRIRQAPGLEGTLLVALTGYGGEEERRRGREAGFDHYLVKPADLADLRRVLAGRHS